VDRQEQARADRARRALGEALDEVEQTLYPGHVGKMLAWTLKRSLRRHTVGWAVAGSVAVALAVGLAVWAVTGDDDDL
jgi:ABC-type nitrate/sulfonate/bicarbonate transport system permease component